MKKNTKPMINLLFLFFIGITLHAQEAFVVSGGTAITNEGSVSYSVGQAFTQTASSESGNLTAGVQQAFEIEVVSAVKDAESIALSCKAYPNPTIDYLQLDIEGTDFESLSYQMFNSKGQLIADQTVMDQVTTINMQEHLPAIYILRVMSKSIEVKTFRIVKN